MVLLALILGTNLRLTPQGVSQVATSALLVLFVGGASSLAYAGSRILESILGALVGVGVNALLAPPSYLPEARAAQQALAQAIAQCLADLAAGLRQGLTPERAGAALTQARALDGRLVTVQAALARAEESLKYNIRGRGQREQLARYQRSGVALDRATRQARGLARTLPNLLDGGRVPNSGAGLSAPGALDAACADLLAALAAAVVQATTAAHAGGPATLDVQAALTGSARCRQAVERAAHAQAPPLPLETWMHLGAFLAYADRMAVDLAAAAEIASAPVGEF
jgi:hypothetical protein